LNDTFRLFIYYKTKFPDIHWSWIVMSAEESAQMELGLNRCWRWEISVGNTRSCL